MYEIYAIILALFIAASSFPVYSTIRKNMNGIEGSFDPIEQHPDEFEQSLIDFETDGVEYWINASKGMWGEREEEINDK